MATHDYVIANQGFPAFRSDLNDVLQAIVSNNSNATAPSTTYAYQMWYETDTNNWYMRNADNDAWITLATFNQTNDTVNFIDSSTTVAGISTSASATVLTLANGVVAINPAGYVSVGGAATQSGEIRFLEDTDNGANYVAVKSPTANVAGANFTLTLPEITGDVIAGKTQATNFTDSLLVGHATSGTLSGASYNTGVGIEALDALTSGTSNVAMGYRALSKTTDGLKNTAIGRYALFDVVSGESNTAIGDTSGFNVTGDKNITIGWQSGDNITSGDGNVIIGNVDADSATGNQQLKIADGVDGSVAWISGDSNGQVKLISGYVLEVALTDASTITWNAATQPVAKVTLGASRTMGLPANPVSGQFISLLIIQDGTGSRTITWNAAYEFALDTAPTLTATANLGDLFTFRYNGAKWLEVGRNLALTLS